MLRSHFRFCTVVLALSVALLTSAEARTFKAAAVNSSASVTDGLAQVTFKIELTNDESSAMTNVFVVFEDGTEVSLGDVAAAATVQSDTQSRTIDVSEATTRTLVMKVTLKYSLDGDAVEVPWMFSVLAE